ncbi:helix-turn-helix domain-containing protein [Eggerthella sp. AM16-19]
MRLKGLNNKKLAAILGLTEVHVSRLKNTNIKAIRLDTLNSLCEVLECEPGDIIKRIP